MATQRIDMYSDYQTFRTKQDVKEWLGEGGTVHFGCGNLFHIGKTAALTYSYGAPTLTVRLSHDSLDELPDTRMEFRGGDFETAYAVCRAFVGSNR